MERGAGGRAYRTGFMAMAVLIGVIFLLNCSRADTAAPEQQIQMKLSAIYGERYLDVQWRTESLESIALEREFGQPLEYTFTEQITLVGEAETGTSIAVCVYTVDDQNAAEIWYHAEYAVGASGIFQENVPLPRTGRQYLMILASRDGQAEGIHYEFYRNSEEVCKQLLDYTLNIYARFKS